MEKKVSKNELINFEVISELKFEVTKVKKI